MIDENNIADILSGLKTLSEDRSDARTLSQKDSWSRVAGQTMDRAFELINEMIVDANQLRPEIDGIRKDAERYRWLRDKADSADWESIGYLSPEAGDAEIDAAIARGSE